MNRLLRVITPIAVALLLFVPTSAAVAEPTWLPVDDLGASLDTSVVDLNARGDAAVAYKTDAGIVVRSHEAGGSWSAPTTVFPGSTANVITVGIDGRGRATVVELRKLGDGAHVIVARSRTSRGWGPAKRISKVAGYINSVELDVAPSGAAVVAFVAGPAPFEDRPHAVRRSGADAGWSAPKVLSTKKNVALTRPAIDRKGRATIAWHRQSGSGRVLEMRTSSASGAFGRVTRISSGTGNIDGLWLAGNEAGDVAVAWRWTPSSSATSSLRIRTRKPGGRFGAPKSLASSSGSGAWLSNVDIEVAADGRVITAWARRVPTPAYSLETRQRRPGRAWTAPRTIYSGSVEVSDHSVRPTAGNGTAFVWAHSGSGGVEVYSRQVSGAGSLSAQQHVIHAAHFIVPVASSGAGDVVVAPWQGDDRVRLRVLDTAGPVAQLRRPSTRFTSSKEVTGSWSAVDAWSTVSSYTVSRRTAKLTGGFQRSKVWTTTSTRSKSFTGTAGTTYCLRVRAKDSVGNSGPSSAERCTAVPVDDRGLAVSSGWSRAKKAGSYLGTVTQTSAKGRSLSVKVRTKRLALIAAKCAFCGVVDVYLGNTRLKRVSLKGTSRQRVLIPVKSFGSARSGKVRIVVVSSGKKVVIDGLAASQR